MSDPGDLEKLLDAPYEKTSKESNHRSRSNEKSRKRSCSRSRRRSRSNRRSKSKRKDDRHKHRSKKSRSRSRKSRSRSRRRHRSKSRSGRKRRSRSRSNKRRRSKSRSNRRRRSRSKSSRRRRSSRSNKRNISRDESKLCSRDRNGRSTSSDRRRRVEHMTEEEKDTRTVYVWQLSLRVRTKDLEEFFGPIGKMDIVRLVLDNKTGKSRGVAFIQFRQIESVNKALDLNAQKLLGVPVQIRTVSSEKCRAAEGTMNSTCVYFRGSTKLCVSNLHPQISEAMIEEIFTPYGKIDELKLMKDAQGVSLGTAFMLFRKGESAKNVVEQMNDFNLAGQLLKITPVIQDGGGGLNDFGDSNGVSMTASDRAGLMAKLAVGTGLQTTHNNSNEMDTPVVNSQCFVLTNMFESHALRQDRRFVKEVHDDVVGECNQFGGVFHVYVDKDSVKGEVYVKCPSVYVANKCVSTLHGRSFDGRLITANYIPLDYYHQMFPDSIAVRTLVRIDD